MFTNAYAHDIGFDCDQTKALEAYNDLINNFRKESRMITYPDEFGGAYLDKEDLIIQLLDTSDDYVQKYRVLTNYSDSIRFEKVVNSYNSLLSLYDDIDELFKGYTINGYGVDVINNNLKVSFGINHKVVAKPLWALLLNIMEKCQVIIQVLSLPPTKL